MGNKFQVIIYFKFDDGSFVIVNVTIVWCRKYGDNDWELGRTVPLVHFVAVKLGFVGSQNGQ